MSNKHIICNINISDQNKKKISSATKYASSIQQVHLNILFVNCDGSDHYNEIIFPWKMMCKWIKKDNKKKASNNNYDDGPFQQAWFYCCRFEHCSLVQLNKNSSRYIFPSLLLLWSLSIQFITEKKIISSLSIPALCTCLHLREIVPWVFCVKCLLSRKRWLRIAYTNTDRPSNLHQNRAKESRYEKKNYTSTIN